MLISNPQPIDARFVQMVCEYLERIEHSIRTKPEPAHMRLLAPTKCLVSDAVAEAISATASRWECEDSSLTAWQLDSVILWARELVELEMRSVALPHINSDYARSVRAAGYVARPVPHRIRCEGHLDNGSVTYT